MYIGWSRGILSVDCNCDEFRPSSASSKLLRLFSSNWAHSWDFPSRMRASASRLAIATLLKQCVKPAESLRDWMVEVLLMVVSEWLNRKIESAKSGKGSLWASLQRKNQCSWFLKNKSCCIHITVKEQALTVHIIAISGTETCVLSGACLTRQQTEQARCARLACHTSICHLPVFDWCGRWLWCFLQSQVKVTPKPPSDNIQFQIRLLMWVTEEKHALLGNDRELNDPLCCKQ